MGTWLRRGCSKSSSLQSKKMVPQTVKADSRLISIKDGAFFFLNGMRSCTGGGRVINHWQEHGGQLQFAEYRQVRQKKRTYKIREGGRRETAVEDHGKDSKNWRALSNKCAELSPERRHPLTCLIFSFILSFPNLSNASQNAVCTHVLQQSDET